MEGALLSKTIVPIDLVNIKAQISQELPILAEINKLIRFKCVLVMMITVEKGFISLDVDRSLLLMNTAFASFVDCTNLALSNFVMSE